MHGTGPDDVWAVGRDGIVGHLDGHHWRQLPLPGDATENLTGVWALSKDEVYICSTTGTIFHGSSHGLERLGEYPYSFYGIVEFQGEFYLAAGEAGVCALRGDKMRIARGTFASTGVYRLPTRLAFVEPTQEDPSIIIHDPRSPRPWTRWVG